MRNSTMQDKLGAVLGVPKQIAMRSKNILAGHPQKVAAPPRYISPPKKSNPFTHHAWSTEIADPEIANEPAATADGSEQIEEVAMAASQPIAAVASLLPAGPVLVPKLEPIEPEAQPEVEAQEEPPQLAAATEVASPSAAADESASQATAAGDLPSQEAVPVPSISTLSVLPSLSPLPQDEPAAPAVSIPPDLAWLAQPTPFQEPLKFIVDRVRGAKATVNFTLGESLRRQKELRNQSAAIDIRLNQEASVEAEQRQKLRQLDEMLSVCGLVAEQSMTVEGELLTSHAQKKHQPAVEAQAKNGAPPVRRAYTKRNRRWDAGDESMCRRQDILRFFAANPNIQWRAPEIRDQLPAAKRAHAKEYLNVLLATLHKEGKLERPGPGVYRMAEKDKTLV